MLVLVKGPLLLLQVLLSLPPIQSLSIPAWQGRAGPESLPAHTGREAGYTRSITHTEHTFLLVKLLGAIENALAVALTTADM